MSRHRAAWVVAAALVLATGLIACQPTRPSPTPPPVASATAQPSPTILATTVVDTPTAPPTGTPVPLASATTVATPAARAPATTPPQPVHVVAIPSPPARDLVDLQRRLKPVATPVARPTTGPAPNYAVGTDQTFWVANQEAQSYFHVRARIVDKTDHAYWYVQDGVDLATSDLHDAATYFEEHTYSTEHQLFGSEWSPGIDDDEHITILVGHIPGVGGYYSTADEYDRQVNPYSNQREMIYINVDSVRPGGVGFNHTVAHEFMHMIQFNVNRWQNSWVDEGSAELAAQAVTGEASGALGAFERDPDTQLNAWASEPSAATPHYGAAYLFMRYVSEQFGGFQSIGKVVAEPDRGMASFERFFQAIRPARTFDQVFADWVAANALDDPVLDHAQLGYHGLRLSLSITPGPAMSAALTGTVHQFGTDYYSIRPTGPATLEFSGAPRTELTGANPHGAAYEWWSNRGDSIDTRLTRAVDLTGVKSATLHFWIWYDVEKDFDYGYVEASTDGGRSWQTLSASDTTTSNPNGQSYGNGFTGTSGGSVAIWVPESVNLSSYAGRQILVRFEYVTDDSYNGDGIAVDGVEIPQIGFHDATLSDDGWTAEGFVRIDNQWPQSYLVEVLTRSATPPVQRMQLDARDRGRLAIKGGQSAIVAVAGLAPITTHSASFQVRLVPN